MSYFNREKKPIARVRHRCCECGTTIHPGNIYSHETIFSDGEFSSYKTCSHCVSARTWLIGQADWPQDIDGEGFNFYFTMLREHLLQYAHDFDPKHRFRAYRHIIAMDKRGKS